jgi:hypothetical protein
MFAAEGDHLANAAHGQPRFSRTRFVVQAGVKNAAIVAALMTAHGGLFLKNGDPSIREALSEPPSGCQSDDASADHDD